MFRKVLIANRGEIAVRIIRACREIGIPTVAIYSQADANSLHVRLATEAYCIGPASSSKSYLSIPAIMAAADVSGADAIHPGYGFMSERADFAEICEKQGIKFIGPTADAMRKMGDKATARQTMIDNDVPVTPGTGILKTPAEVKALLKAKKLSPEGKPLNSINVRRLEETLDKHPFISDAECYLTSGGKVGIEIYQRIPLMRIMSDNGDNYYIDQEGNIMSAPGKPVHVAVATGYIDRKFAQEELHKLGNYLQADPFWSAQIEQIHVTPKLELELVPRVGDHILFLGKAGNYDEKFRKLRTFYEEALSHVGWNKYKRISIEFNNQIICTKKEK